MVPHIECCEVRKCLLSYNSTQTLPVVPIDITKSFENMSMDEKLNLLITSVSKLENVPKDIETMQVSIAVIQNDLKTIPELKSKIKTIEDDLRAQKSIVDRSKITTAALEASVTNTQKDVDDFNKKNQRTTEPNGSEQGTNQGF